jgi:hypothetical protein
VCRARGVPRAARARAREGRAPRGARDGKRSRGASRGRNGKGARAVEARGTGSVREMQRNGQKPARSTPKKQARDRIRARESVRRSLARAAVRAKRQNQARRHSAAIASLANEQTGGLRAQTGGLGYSAAIASLAIETKCVTDNASRCVVYAPSLTGASSKSLILQCATDGAPIAKKESMDATNTGTCSQGCGRPAVNRGATCGRSECQQSATCASFHLSRANVGRECPAKDASGRGCSVHDTRGTYYGGVNSEPCGTCGPCKHYDFRGCWSPVRKDGK